MILASVLIPETDNTGNEVLPETIERLCNHLLRDFGGFSKTPGVIGAWRTNIGGRERVFHDRLCRYDVALDSWLALPLFIDFITHAQQVLHQQAMYVTIAGIPEILDLSSERLRG